MYRLIQAFLLFLISNIHDGFSQKENNNEYDLLKSQFLKTSKELNTNSFLKTAMNYFYQKEWDSTLIYSQKFIETSNVPEQLDIAHFLRGYSFDKKRILKESELEYLKVSEEFKFYNDVITYLGLLSLEQERYKMAIGYFKQVIELPEKEFQFIKKSSVTHNLGVAYLHLRDFKESEKYLIKSVELQEKEKDTSELVGSYSDIANLYYEQYKDDEAISYFKKAYELSKSARSFQLKLSTAINMSVVEENRKDFEKALAYRKEAQQWKDSLNDQNKIYDIAKLEKEFAVQQKQKEVDLYLYLALVLILFLIFGAYFYYEKVRSNRIISRQKETLDELNTTKDKLFSIVSHDLRSSVNALKLSNKELISNLTSKNLSALENLLQKNSNIVNGTFGLLDNLLNWALLQTEQQSFFIEKTYLFTVVEHVSYNYIPFMSDKSITFENTISRKDIVYIDRESLKVVLRNLLDNAIKFSKLNGIIKVYTENTSKDYCDLIIEDNGGGMSEETRLELLEDSVLLNKRSRENIIGTGLGLQLCKSIIKKNSGKFNIESRLGKGTKMIVSLPKSYPNGKH